VRSKCILDSAQKSIPGRPKELQTYTAIPGISHCATKTLSVAPPALNDRVLSRERQQERNHPNPDSYLLRVVTEQSDASIAADPRAVRLLFAGADDDSFTLANPISSVLKRLSTATREVISMVGSCTAAATQTPRSQIIRAGNLASPRRLQRRRLEFVTCTKTIS
jgi:hypothetical protein